MKTFPLDGVEYPLEPVTIENPGWKVFVNGKAVENVQTLVVVNENFGAAGIYGMSPTGRPYDQLSLINRGGAVIVVTAEIGNDLYFLALRQHRPHAGPEAILEFPRGQAIAGEKAITTARRELLEETGLPISSKSLTYLGAANPDTSFIFGANVHCWWLRLPSEFIATGSDGQPGLRPDLVPDSPSRLLESIMGADLVHEHDFASPSMLTAWAMGLVLQRIRRMTATKAVNMEPAL